MSSKKSKSNDNIEQEALKEVEIIAELAPNEKTRKEAEKLRATIEGESAASVHEQELEGVDNVLDETKKALKNTANQAQIEIPKYTKVMGELQEEGVELQRRTASLMLVWISPRAVAEYYRMFVENFVDSAMSITNFAYNLAMVNIESIQILANTNMEYWRNRIQNNVKRLSKPLVE